MPYYDYKCKNCSYEFEELQKISSTALVTCPKCNTDSLIRIINGGAGLVFKGSGFYLTDYKKSGSSPSGATSETTTKKEEKKTETKTTETKSATTASSDKGESK